MQAKTTIENPKDRYKYSMQCERLIKLAKSWYIHVREETMAPARMISFMENHAADCPVCQEDPDIYDEIAKIKEMILPESKIPKAVRMQNQQAEAEEDEAEDEVVDEESDGEDVYHSDDDDEDMEEEPDLVDEDN